MIYYQYFFGGCSLAIGVQNEVEEQERFELFKYYKKESVQSKVVFYSKKELPEIEGIDLVTEEDAIYSEYKIGNKYIRTFHGNGTKEPYAILEKTNDKCWRCSYLEEFGDKFQTIGDLFGYIALERILLNQNAGILHASFVKVNGEGILFTGSSGSGKSTQAEMWRKYQQADIINGDKTILKKQNGRWYAFGSPYAGSSRIWRNECAPIKAIVFLGKDPDTDKCFRLEGVDAFRVIYSNLTMNIWNKEYMNKTMEFVQEICMQIPIFYLQCRPEKSATECLKRCIEKRET